MAGASPSEEPVVPLFRRASLTHKEIPPESLNPSGAQGVCRVQGGDPWGQASGGQDDGENCI